MPARASAPSRFLIGRVSRPHGITGELKIQLEPEYEGAFPPGAPAAVFLNDAPQATPVSGSREHQGALLLRLATVRDRNAAELMRGVRVSVDEAHLPKIRAGEYYAHDLVGLKVVDMTGALLGVLEEVLATGSNDVYVVRRPDERELLLPAIESCIQAIDFDAECVRVIIPAGLEDA